MTLQEYHSKIQFSNHSFVDGKEWYYIESNPYGLDFNFLFFNLNYKKLFSDSVNICDAGFGLGTTMYDFYIQSKRIKDVNFSFFGVEKYKEYIDYFDQNLKQYWDDNITIYNQDIMDHNYSRYNMVYTYAPFKKEEDLLKLYQKIIDEIPSNSILIEYAEEGKGFYNSILTTNQNNPETTKIIYVSQHNILLKQ